MCSHFSVTNWSSFLITGGQCKAGECVLLYPQPHKCYPDSYSQLGLKPYRVWRLSQKKTLWNRDGSMNPWPHWEENPRSKVYWVIYVHLGLYMSTHYINYILLEVYTNLSLRSCLHHNSILVGMMITDIGGSQF